MNLRNKSVMVTGGAGFIGSHLVDHVIKENPEKVIVVDNFFLGKYENLTEANKLFPSLKIYRQDATNYNEMEKIMKEEGVDVAFNLAIMPLPLSLTKPGWSFDENIKLTTTICELARKDLFKTLIHFSSSEVYGTSEYAPMDEKHPLNCTTPYAASKAASDLLVTAYYETFGIEMSIIRPFNNYGPRQNEGSYAGVIPATIKRILEGKPPIIYGDGKQTRDYLYVTDTAKAAVHIYNSKRTRSKVLNIASGSEVSIDTVIRLISEYLGFNKSPIYEPRRPGDVRRHIASIYLAKDLIGFKPTVKFEEGLKKTVEWYVSKMQPKRRKGD